MLGIVALVTMVAEIPLEQLLARLVITWRYLFGVPSILELLDPRERAPARKSAIRLG